MACLKSSISLGNFQSQGRSLIFNLWEIWREIWWDFSKESLQYCRKVCWAKMVQKGPYSEPDSGIRETQMDLNGPLWPKDTLVHLGPPTVFWPLLVFGPTKWRLKNCWGKNIGAFFFVRKFVPWINKSFVPSSFCRRATLTTFTKKSWDIVDHLHGAIWTFRPEVRKKLRKWLPGTLGFGGPKPDWNLWKPLRTPEKGPSQRHSWRQISLSEALGPVARIHLPLKTLSEFHGIFRFFVPLSVLDVWTFQGSSNADFFSIFNSFLTFWAPTPRG